MKLSSEYGGILKYKHFNVVTTLLLPASIARKGSAASKVRLHHIVSENGGFKFIHCKDSTL